MAKQQIFLPLKGSCQCGEITYEITEMPITLYVCHCTECQKQSSSGYGMSMQIPKTGFLLNGAPKIWGRKSESGSTVECAFCAECGTRLFHLPLRNDSIVNIKPGTLNDTSWLKPVGHLWVNSAQRGVLFSPESLRYEHQPKTFKPLYEAWLDQYETASV